MTVVSTRMDPGNPGNPGNVTLSSRSFCLLGVVTVFRAIEIKEDVSSRCH